MKKYVVPAMKLHQLKAASMICESAPGKEGGNPSVATQKYVYDNDFDSSNLYEE